MAATGIRDRFGAEKALGYLIGEKFYNLVSILQSSRRVIRTIDDERKQPDYNPIRVTRYKNRKYVNNLDDIYHEEKEIIVEAEGLLGTFVSLIKEAFENHEIRKYFESHPRLGMMGHISTDEEYEFLVSRGAVEHSIATEVEDALIFGAMMKFFGVS